MSSIAGFVGLDDTEDPELLYRKAVSQREELLAKAAVEAGRAIPTSSPKFEELYEAARYSFPRHRGPRVLHRPARRRRVPPVRARRRRPARGRRASSTSADDVFFLRGDEVARRADATVAIGAPTSPSRRATFEARRQGRRRPAPSARRRHPRRRAARSVHGRARLPAARHGAARRQPRPEHHQGRRRLAGRRTPARPASCGRSPRLRTSRRARSWCAR